MIASAFRLSLEQAEHFRESTLVRLSPWLALIVAITGGALAGGIGLWLVRRCAPEAAGSGIPHLKSVLHGETKMRWKRLLPVKFLAGLFSIGGGLALGREGPTVQMGGATGLMIAGWFRIKSGFGERKALISAGAGAGLAAAFNAPLAGVIRAPLTGIVLMVEMTGNYDFMLPLLVSYLTAYGIAEAFRAPAIYEALRHRRSAAG